MIARPIPWSCLLLLLCCGFAAATRAEDKPSDAAPPGVEIRSVASPRKATVGDPIRIDFDITTPSGYKVNAPTLPGQMGDFVLLQVFPGPTVPEADRQPAQAALPVPGSPVHYRARVVVAAYRPGEYSFPAVSFELNDPKGGAFLLKSEPLKIEIQSTLAAKDQELKDLKNQADIPEPIRWALWLAIALLLLIIAGIAWWLFRRRHGTAEPGVSAKPGLDPLQLAESELRDLLGRGLIESGLVKKFYVILSEIAKRMLEAGYGIQTVEKTTAEILEELNSVHPRIAQDAELERVRSFLVACDLVKFAKFVPSLAENEVSVKLVFEILDSCKRARAAQPLVTLTAGVA